MSTAAMEVLVRSYSSRYPADAARALESLRPADAAEVVTRLAPGVAGPVLAKLLPGPAAAILLAVGADGTRELLRRLDARQAASILQHLEEAARESTLQALGPEAAQQLRDLMQYPPGTAGALMDPRVVSLRSDLTVGEAIARIRRSRKDTLPYLYVTDPDGRLVGVLRIRDLLFASPRDSIGPLVSSQVVTVPASMPRADMAELIRRRHFLALPVVDLDGRMLGAIKSDSILEGLEQKAFGDLQKMVGAGEDERALSPVSVVVRKRLPWLYVNLVTAFAAAAVVGLFEGTIERVTALAVLLPVVAGQGGNTGAQSLAVVMRGMALNELVPGSAKRLLIKESLGGLLNGIAVALGTGLAVYLWDGRLALVAVITLAMVVNMAAAGLSGAAIPLILRAVGRDPAQSSSIFLTTVTDIVGFAAFLGLAVIFLPMLES